MTLNTGGRVAWGEVRQLGYVVKDVNAAARAWSERLGVGPWTVIRNVPLACVYRGRQSAPMIDIALAYRGDLQIELIQQTNDAPSPYREFIDLQRYGQHHAAFLCADIATAVQQGLDAGLELVCDISMPTGGRYTYFASPVEGENTYLELLEATPMMLGMFQQGIDAAKAWDGSSHEPYIMDFAALSAG